MDSTTTRELEEGDRKTRRRRDNDDEEETRSPGRKGEKVGAVLVGVVTVGVRQYLESGWQLIVCSTVGKQESCISIFSWSYRRSQLKAVEERGGVVVKRYERTSV